MKKIGYIDRATYVITGVVLLVAAFAICVGFGLIQIGQNGINFSF
jgi:hypothetical protein